MLDLSEILHMLYNYTTLEDIRTQNSKLIIDNTPFPRGYIQNYEPLDVFVMKENIYQSSFDMYTATYSLILVFTMLVVILLGVSLKYHRLRT